ncbi:hypothetical protein P5673_031179 [Acropora cervicornis]|uniref:Uncharacterized protein n=1 Tax=Acropora cervicornis TaxID=6130 RepID=A0AAD9PT28_ACRCE|nr:hypothetical protein P5673_031179 [Acropora cervicornis]
MSCSRRMKNAGHYAKGLCHVPNMKEESEKESEEKFKIGWFLTPRNTEVLISIYSQPKTVSTVLPAAVVQGAAACPHRLVLCFNRTEGDRAKIAGIALLLSYHLPMYAKPGMNDGIGHVVTKV